MLSSHLEVDLLIAVQMQDEKEVKRLLKQGALPNFREYKPLREALKLANENIDILLIKYGANIDFDSFYYVREVVRRNKVKVFDFIIHSDHLHLNSILNCALEVSAMRGGTTIFLKTLTYQEVNTGYLNSFILKQYLERTNMSFDEFLLLLRIEHAPVMSALLKVYFSLTDVTPFSYLTTCPAWHKPYVLENIHLP